MARASNRIPLSGRGRPPLLALGSHAEDDAPPRLTNRFPSILEIVEANRVILDAYGHLEDHVLRDRGHLVHALEVAKAKQRETPGRNGLIAAAAYLAHGIARAQAFRDGNHRIGHLACQGFLRNNGLGNLSPLGFDDDELATHLEGTGIRRSPAAYGPEDTIVLLARRAHEP